MMRRPLLLLAASAALHLAAIGLALRTAGAGAVSPILVDLLADLAGGTARHDRAPSPRPPSEKRPRDALASRRSGSLPFPTAPRESGATPGNPALEVAVPHALSPPAEPAGEPAPVMASTGSRVATAAPALRDEPREDGVGARAVSTADGAAGGTMRSASVGGAAEGERAGDRGGPGSPAADASPGDGRGGIPPEYGPYLRQFRERVQESLHYPLAARRQGLSGKLELEVLLEPSGRVSGVQLISSSSHPMLDEAALVAVKSLSPEPFPEALPRRLLRIRLPLAFELR